MALKMRIYTSLSQTNKDVVTPCAADMNAAVHSVPTSH